MKARGGASLRTAASKGDASAVVAILKQESRPKFIDECDKDGYSALNISVLRGHLPVVKLLLKGGADVNKAMGNGIPPLYLAIFRCRHSMVDMLLERGAEVKHQAIERKKSSFLLAFTDTLGLRPL